MTAVEHARPEYVEVTEPLGPGLDYEVEPAGHRLVAVRRRDRLAWLGFDRAEVIDSDDGSGRSLRALVGVPASTFAGCRIRVTWAGGVMDVRGPILVGRVDGMPEPLPAIVRTVAAVPDGPWIDAAAAAHLAAEARRQYRTRRASDRILGGRAWEPRPGSLEDARFTSPHARSEYSINHLPPRFLRGLRQLLDPDEHVLYAIERPAITSSTFVDRVARRIDRRAALLVLTDRQVAWVVDHADPDRYLSDWGVDVEVLPVERLRAIDATTHGDRGVELRFTTAQGATAVLLPPEYEVEARIAVALASRFLPLDGVTLPRRSYPVGDTEPDWSRPETFGQEADARELHARLGRPAAAVLYSPRRPGQRKPMLWAVAGRAIMAVSSADEDTIPLEEVHSLRLVLSPLAGRLEVIGGHHAHVTYPGPMSDMAADLVRAARRRMADT